jgi:putative hydrolase of the HAD superfamily
MLPEAVIFDMDGLLVDTETCDYEAWKELHEAHGLELTLADFCYSAGLYGTWERMYEAIAAVSGLSPDELHAWRNPRFRERVEACLQPSEELLRLLEALRANEIRRGIASSSDSDWVAFLLDGIGLRHEFQAIATGHDVARRKPAPDVYLLAAERLGVDPRRAVALEDSAHGIEAARAAGMRVVAIPNPVSRHQDLSQADARVEHFGDVTLDLLRRLVAR